ncbi:PspC domain-containing protein [Nesterenkonia aurantiaca]|uniref:PspC domain-containing protein n=1 Tax=Nesterenkonia aurantiaca TaxID=1436010 RepID=UPI003EE69A7A
MDNQKPETGRRFFDWMRTTGLVRPEEGWLGGIFAGISLKVGWDAALVRGLGVVAFIIFFSPAALLYGLAWIFIPDREGRIHAQQAVRGDYTSGFIGGAVLTVIGALNIFTPVSIAGPLAVLLNLVILAAVGWAIYVMVRNHRRRSSTAGTQGSASGAAGRSTPGRFDASGQGSAGKAEAGNSKPPRADGKPAWYPKEDSATPSPAAHASPAASAAAPASFVSARTREPRPQPSFREQAARRRRRQLSWGLAMLALPVIVGLAWLGGGLGLSSTTVAIAATAGLVLVLGLTHFTAALRGRPGTPGLLALSTAVMLVLFAGQSASGFSGGSNHAFGDYTTTETQVQSVFANTTVDLRDLEALSGPADPVVWDAQVNQAFSNTTVIVPDETQVLLSNGQALSNLEIATQDDGLERSGISGGDLVIGPEDSEDQIHLELNSAFGNITIYDSTTYEQEGEQR